MDSDYSASVSSFPFLPDSASQWLPQCPALAFAPAVFPVLPCLVSRALFPGSKYSAILYVSFRPSLIRSHSCFSGAYLPISLPVFSVLPSVPFRSLPLPFRLLSLCFFLSALRTLRLTAGFPSRLRFLSSPSLFPDLHGWFPVRFPPVLLTQLSVRFLSSFPASLPQLFHRCFPFGFLLRDRCLTSAFFRPLPS